MKKPSPDSQPPSQGDGVENTGRGRDLKTSKAAAPLPGERARGIVGSDACHIGAAKHVQTEFELPERLTSDVGGEPPKSRSEPRPPSPSENEGDNVTEGKSETTNLIERSDSDPDWKGHICRQILELYREKPSIANWELMQRVLDHAGIAPDQEPDHVRSARQFWQAAQYRVPATVLWSLGGVLVAIALIIVFTTTFVGIPVICFGAYQFFEDASFRQAVIKFVEPSLHISGWLMGSLFLGVATGGGSSAFFINRFIQRMTKAGGQSLKD